MDSVKGTCHSAHVMQAPRKKKTAQTRFINVKTKADFLQENRAKFLINSCKTSSDRNLAIIYHSHRLSVVLSIVLETWQRNL